MKMKPKPSTILSALWSIGPVARSLNSGYSTAPTTIIPATRHAARKAKKNDEEAADQCHWLTPSRMKRALSTVMPGLDRP